MSVESFADIRRQAEAHHGGEAGVDARLAGHGVAGDPAALSDDRILSEMAKRVFQAGFSWKVIEQKWPGFEEVFDHFDIAVNTELSAERLASLMADTRIVRNKPKILAVRDNALLVEQMAALDGSAGNFLSKWPRDDQVGLLDYLRQHGSRLGGTTGQYFLRFIGWDGFVLSKDVVTALGRAGVIDGPATSKSALAKIQAAFNAWHEESGLPRALISRTLALSVG
ncbi:DNA-3-methyladenine glycosylase I [Nisaea acidiphila]|uniref:DNA-3-methyladenine glycosylase I n=1 Tax=Nisaea acidiphila TaxID=1862145 RepID=A0A9J7ALZ6_9PROT|nr:DNA-3-methyladenine glycosylase I [Nisaea acidiphila]UUX48496.1 DNA-3-methyladenine glycosylase I [Nisaea acidiphila]